MKPHPIRLALVVMGISVIGCAPGSPPFAKAMTAEPVSPPSTLASASAAPPKLAEPGLTVSPLGSSHPNVDAMQERAARDEARVDDEERASAFASMAPAAVPPGFKITLERKACYGTCPAYKVSIDASGLVLLTSSSPKQGCAKRTVPPTEVGKLVSLVDTVGFVRLKPKYTASVTDHAWAIVTVAKNGQTKTVEHYLADGFGAGDDTDRASLRQLESAIDTVSHAPELASRASEPLGPCKGAGAYPIVTERRDPR